MLAALAFALRAAASAVATVGRCSWWAIEWTATLPWRAIRAMVPSGGAGSVPLPPDPTSSASDTALAEVRSLVDSAAARRAAVAGSLPQDLSRRADGTSPVGDLVHAYAAASPEDRRRLSLGVLSPDQATWLLRLRPEQLERLALAGPRACERLASGRRGGVVGVEPCRSGAADASEVEEAASEERPVTKLDLTPAAMADRIRRRRGLVRAA